MKSTSSSTHSREIAARLGEAALGLLTIAVIVLLWPKLSTARQGYWQAQQETATQPARTSQQAELQTALKRREHDLARIDELIITRAEVADFVGVLEREARRTSVQLTIPDIRNNMILDQKGKPIPVKGPLQDVRLHITAAGEPEALLRFLHTLEHIPYLVRVVSWEIRSDIKDVSNRRVPPSDGGATPPPTPPGKLDITALLTIKSDAVSQTDENN